MDHWTGEKNAELYQSFIDLFSCPLCRHQPLTINEAYFDASNFAVFTLTCKKCRGIIEYFVGDSNENIETTKKMLLNARILALESLTPIIDVRKKS